MKDWGAVLAEASEKIGAVKKDGRNTRQNYVFRGIDAVVNAVHPVFADMGISVTPELVSVDYADIEAGEKRTPMVSARVVVAYVFRHLDLAPLRAVVAAEAMDSGDKATAKAMSVAFRTCLLQVLLLPTDEPDPDSNSYERAPREAKPHVEVPKEYRDTIEAATSVEQLEHIAASIPEGETWSEAAKSYARLHWQRVRETWR